VSLGREPALRGQRIAIIFSPCMHRHRLSLTNSAHSHHYHSTTPPFHLVVSCVAGSWSKPPLKPIPGAPGAGRPPPGGGNGDDIRMEILHIMRGNGIKEGHRPVSQNPTSAPCTVHRGNSGPHEGFSTFVSSSRDSYLCPISHSVTLLFVICCPLLALPRATISLLWSTWHQRPHPSALNPYDAFSKTPFVVFFALSRATTSPFWSSGTRSCTPTPPPMTLSSARPTWPSCTGDIPMQTTQCWLSARVGPLVARSSPCAVLRGLPGLPAQVTAHLSHSSGNTVQVLYSMPETAVLYISGP